MIYKFSQIVLSAYGFYFSLSIFHELELYENSDIGVFVPFADVFLKHHGPCSGPDDHPCGSVPEEEHRQPVCGTDGRSYVSPEALWCAKLRSSQTGEICKSYCISMINPRQILSFIMLARAKWKHFHPGFSLLINLLTLRKITRASRNFGFVTTCTCGFSTQQEKRNFTAIFGTIWRTPCYVRESVPVTLCASNGRSDLAR